MPRRVSPCLLLAGSLAGASCTTSAPPAAPVIVPVAASGSAPPARGELPRREALRDAPESPDLTAALGGPVPASCQGPHIRLDLLGECRCRLAPTPIFHDGKLAQRAGSGCGATLEERDLRGLVRSELVAAESLVAPGATLALTLRVVNLASRPLPLILDRASSLLSDDSRPVLTTRDTLDRDVSVGGDCVQGVSADLQDYLVVPDAGTAISHHLEWRAATRVSTMGPAGQGCQHLWQPLPEGLYRVSLRLPVRGASSSTGEPQIFIEVRR